MSAPYAPAGDQPAAIAQLTQALTNGERYVCLNGITGSGKSAVMAWTIEQLGRPTLVIAPNKSLAAQLAGELAGLLPDNKVCFFVSYYDYYQPEAYVAASDTFIDKEAMINPDIDRLRHDTTAAVLHRSDVVVVASVSCIYGLGNPETYKNGLVAVSVGQKLDRDALSRQLVANGYTRCDVDPPRGTFRVRGDTMDIHQSGHDTLWRIEWFGDDIERISEIDTFGTLVSGPHSEAYIWPATHYGTETDAIGRIVERIENELQQRLGELRSEEKLLEARRLEQRTRNDLDMLRETGFCRGIENYSAHIDGRQPGERPFTLLDFFPDDRLVFIDESHVAISQLHSAFAGDASRKANLIEHGFRLPSAADNRPLRFDEFEACVPQAVLVTATPGEFEREHCDTFVELVVRPTGLLDPEITICPATGQIDDLTDRIRNVTANAGRTLVTCITKRSAEQLADHLAEHGIKAGYLHSDIDTLERIAVIDQLRQGSIDVLVGVNLLREGLDLPEVQLVAILDADQQGFLRSQTALMQTIGRAARNEHGHAVLYADKTTPAIDAAVAETRRRRERQLDYNTQMGITPKSTSRSVTSIPGREKTVADKRPRRAPIETPTTAESDISELETLMHQAAERLEFEQAAYWRDEIARRRKLTASD